MHPGAEPATARGCAQAGARHGPVPAQLDALELVAAAAGTWWLQVYLLRDRGLTLELVRRAAAAGAAALVLTGDTPVLGRREGGGRGRLLQPGQRPLAVLGRDPGVPPGQLEQDDRVGWPDVQLLAAESGLPVVVKGVLRADDTRRAADAGAAGVVVSNHGGRQLDGAVPTAYALPEVVVAAGEDLEVYVDGGLRRGTDVLRALALGARGVLIGRPVLSALALDGERGVTDPLEDSPTTSRTRCSSPAARTWGRSTGRCWRRRDTATGRGPRAERVHT